MYTAIVVRKKGDVTAPLLTSTPETVDLNHFDVFDEHGAPVSEAVLQQIRDIQAALSPPVK
jgi:hypothetical protein